MYGMPQQVVQNRWNMRIYIGILKGKAPDGQDVIGAYAILADNNL